MDQEKFMKDISKIWSDMVCLGRRDQHTASEQPGAENWGN